ncbi:hypothetical protein B7494_g7205 [Chlorociboria aeruginascens]|nr:hypothetical protein B7494_g7205 [Chlorociboria aeruginascens]
MLSHRPILDAIYVLPRSLLFARRQLSNHLAPATNPSPDLFSGDHGAIPTVQNWPPNVIHVTRNPIQPRIHNLHRSPDNTRDSTPEEVDQPLNLQDSTPRHLDILQPSVLDEIIQHTATLSISSIENTPTYTTPLSTSIQPVRTIKMASPRLTFGGHREDAEEYVEGIEQRALGYEEKDRDLYIRVTFREGLVKDAHRWYYGLSKDIRRNWAETKKLFLEKYTEERKENDFDKQWHMMKEVRELKQQDTETEAQYFHRLTKLYERAPPTFQQQVVQKSVSGLRRSELRRQLNSHLYTLHKVDDFMDFVEDATLEDVRKAYLTVILMAGDPVPIAEMTSMSQQEDVEEFPPTQNVIDQQLAQLTQINAGLINVLSQWGNTYANAVSGSRQQAVPLAPPPSLPPPPNPFRPGGYTASITCYNCLELGHPSTQCSRPRTSDAQYRENRQRSTPPVSKR